MTVRVIPRLDIKGPNLVKGIHLEGLRILGPPERFARHYYESGADELIYMDAVASLYGRNSLVEIIERTAATVFIPLTVGGGLRSIEDISQVLRVGADRIALNTAAIERPGFISEAASKFGASTIAVSIEAKRHDDGGYTAFTDNGRDDTGKEVTAWARQATELGAGEIILTSIDREGTGKGYDLDLITRVATAVSVPVVACGGAGNAGHMVAAVTGGYADAVATASALHYPFAGTLQAEGFELESGGAFKVVEEKIGHYRIGGASLGEIKDLLAAGGIDCRH